MALHSAIDGMIIGTGFEVSHDLGLLAALADTVCFFPRPLLPSGQAATTVNLNVSYVRPAAVGDRLLAR
jgi:acyl-coenzyme A thioesterase PaaI-like protein